MSARASGPTNFQLKVNPKFSGTYSRPPNVSFGNWDWYPEGRPQTFGRPTAAPSRETGSGVDSFLLLGRWFGLNLDEAPVKGLTQGQVGGGGDGAVLVGVRRGPGRGKAELPCRLFHQVAVWPCSAGFCCSSPQAFMSVASASSPRFRPCLFALISYLFLLRKPRSTSKSRCSERHRDG